VQAYFCRHLAFSMGFQKHLLHLPKELTSSDGKEEGRFQKIPCLPV